jgi:hypothetical protein
MVVAAAGLFNAREYVIDFVGMSGRRTIPWGDFV